jgi:hypothetical protein
MRTQGRTHSTRHFPPRQLLTVNPEIALLQSLLQDLNRRLALQPERVLALREGGASSSKVALVQGGAGTQEELTCFLPLREMRRLLEGMSLALEFPPTSHGWRRLAVTDRGIETPYDDYNPTPDDLEALIRRVLDQVNHRLGSAFFLRTHRSTRALALEPPGGTPARLRTPFLPPIGLLRWLDGMGLVLDLRGGYPPSRDLNTPLKERLWRHTKPPEP